MEFLKKTLGAATAFFLVCAGAAAQERMSLNGEWDFALRKVGEPVPEHYAGKIKVPSNWAVEGWEEPVYQGFKNDEASEGYYKRAFSVTEDFLKDRRILLHFDGVWESAWPELNGVELGVHDSGYTGFSYDVSKILRAGENVLEVKVVQAGRSYRFDVNDDWSIGGIYRDVWIETMPAGRWMEKPVVITDFDSRYEDATLTVKTIVCDVHKGKVAGNLPSYSEGYGLSYVLLDREGNKVIDEIQTVPGQDNTDKEIVRDFHVESPVAWNAEKPYLYTLHVSLLENGRSVQTRTEKIGFREITVENGVFKLNGTAVKLRGVNRHDEHPDVGRATRAEHWLQDIKMMKENNVNYVRMCHYPPAKGFIEMCDSLGMYVSDEISLGGGDRYFRDPSFSSEVLQRTYETVTRDINSPSVIIWSVGNEDPFTGIHLAAAKFIKALDPTRPKLMPWRAETWMPEEFEILAPHYWQPADYEKLCEESDRPVLTTEYTHAYGIHATGGLDARWKAITKYPVGLGGAVWMWQDQGLKTPVKPEKKSELSDDPYLRLDGNGWDGVVDSYRNPTPDLYEMKAVYAQVFPLVETVPYSGEVRLPIANEFDFTDLSEVKIRWEQHSDSRIVAEGEAVISGAPHSVAELPVKLKSASGGKADWLIIRAVRADGTEMSCSSVELVRERTGKTKDFTKAYDIEKLVKSLRPVVWHKLDDTEELLYRGGEEKDIYSTLDFDSSEAQILSESNAEENGEDVYRAKVRYVVNPENNFVADIAVRLGKEGARVEYSLEPHLQLGWIPVYGMAFAPDRKGGVSYVGDGPWDSYPNKCRAAVFGLWDYDGGFRQARTVYCPSKAGTLEIELDGYLEINDKGEMLLLGGVVSRPEKGRKAVSPFPLLRTEEDAPYRGAFTMKLK